MKKFLSAFLTVLLLVLVLFNTAYAKTSVVERPNIQVYIDGQLGVYSSEPIICEGRTLLPLREILVNLGVPNDDSHINCNSTENSVKIKNNSTKIYLQVDNKTAIVNGKDTTLDAAPVNYKGRVFIPVKFIAQSFGIDVNWDGSTSSVIIGKKPDSSIKQVIVRSAEQFVREIGSNKRILLKPGVYNLSSIKQLNSQDKKVTWNSVDDGKELNLNNITNLSIEGPNKGLAELKINPRYAEIIYFSNCTNINIKNIKAGHTPSKYECTAGVLMFDNCSDININDSELYGCGSVGVSANQTKRLNCTNTLIDHCSLRAVDLFQTEDVKFSGCKLLNNEAYSNIVYLAGSTNTIFENCEMSGNNSFEWSFFEFDGESDLLIDKCKIINNQQPENGAWDESACFFKVVGYDNRISKVIVRDTEFTNNSCDYFCDNKDSVTFENCKFNDNKWKE